MGKLIPICIVMAGWVQIPLGSSSCLCYDDYTSVQTDDLSDRDLLMEEFGDEEGEMAVRSRPVV